MGVEEQSSIGNPVCICDPAYIKVEAILEQVTRTPHSNIDTACIETRLLNYRDLVCIKTRPVLRHAWLVLRHG